MHSNDRIIEKRTGFDRDQLSRESTDFLGACAVGLQTLFKSKLLAEGVADNPPNAAAVQMSQLLDLIPVGLLYLDEHGVVQMRNPEADRIFGVSLMGVNWNSYALRLPHSDNGEPSLFIDDSGTHHTITRLSHESSSGSLVCVIPERGLSDSAFESSYRAMMSDFSHQVRTPLASALLYAECLSGDNLSAEDRDRYVMRLISNLQRIDSMVDYVSSGDDVFKVRERVSLGEIVGYLVSYLSENRASNEVPLSVSVERGDFLVALERDSFYRAISLVVSSLLASPIPQTNLELSGLVHDGKALIRLLARSCVSKTKVTGLADFMDGPDLDLVFRCLSEHGASVIVDSVDSSFVSIEFVI